MDAGTRQMDALHDDVAEFALLLTRLKERSDRSYAALARRLDLHASTLHRYCAGEVVPQDFGGVERFAALCGASPEERVELHRRWILAAAARQQTRPSATRRTPPPAGGTAPQAPETPSASGGPEASSVPEAPSAPEATSAPEGAGASDRPVPSPEPPSSAYNPADGPGSDSRPAPGTPRTPGTPGTPGSPGNLGTAGAAGTPGPPEPAVPPAAPAPHPKRPRQRLARATALAASLAVALAGLTTSAAGPHSAGDGPQASARTAPTPSAATGPSGGGSPTGGEPTPTASTTQPPTTSPKPDKDNRRKKQASSPSDSTAAPLTWTANSHIWRPECDHDYVVAKPPEQVPPPPAPQDAEAWAASLGAEHGRTTHVRISVQGRGSAAVVLEALHVRVVGRTAPAVRRGIAYSMYEGCGAVLIPRHFSVDLDARRPMARSVPGNDPDRPDPAIGFPYRVSLKEPEILLLSARTDSCTCDWYVELEWSSQGRTGTVRIDDRGRPFRTTDIEGLPHYWYRDSEGWVPMTTTYDERQTEDDDGDGH